MPASVAVVLAAGESRRFWPLSAHGHKSLYVLEGTTLLERTLRSLADAGVERFVVVQSPSSPGVLRPCDVLPEAVGAAPIRYVEQPEPAGQGDALLRCAGLLPEAFLLVQPESINAGAVARELADGEVGGDVVTVAVTPRDDWRLYAVVEHEDGRLRAILEKPESCAEPRPLCNMGLYRMTSGFLDYLHSVPPDPHSVIHAIEAAARDGRAGITRSAAEFLPLKYPGHLWGHVRALYGGTIPGDAAGGRAIIGPDCVIDAEARLDNAILGRGVRIGAGTRTDATEPWDDLAAVVIGPGARIGRAVTIARGVGIGAGAVVPDGAAVREDVPDGSGTGATAG